MIIDGKAVASTIQTRVKEGIQNLKGRKPALVFIRVGNDPASITYLKMKKRRCEEVGITSIDRELDATTSEETLLREIAQFNADPNIDGILVQLPLPKQICSDRIIQAIDPGKDVDGFHPLNLGKLLIGDKSGFLSCTPYGIKVLLSHYGIQTEGKHVVIVGRSNIVGKPLAALLMQKEEGANATVTVAHSRTKDLEKHCRSADILVAAIGSARFIQPHMVKEGAVVIDVGIHRLDGKIVGDVDFEKVAPKCSYITQVPGGVGPMTIAMLLSNTLLSYQRRQ
jgi:methylenetetrahydrofolate dehydrogenase (NADP+) / methenyltetrahydrofolate cyclohydrolase